MTYISHHGILGQKWGKRKGPPYPLYRQSGGKISENDSLKKKVGFADGLKAAINKRKLAKAQKAEERKQAQIKQEAELEKQKKETERLQRQAEEKAKKERFRDIANRMDQKKYSENKGDVSDEDLKRLVYRSNMDRLINQNFEATKQAKQKTLARRLYNVANLVNTVSKVAITSATVYATYQKVKNMQGLKDAFGNDKGNRYDNKDKKEVKTEQPKEKKGLFGNKKEEKPKENKETTVNNQEKDIEDTVNKILERSGYAKQERQPNAGEREELLTDWAVNNSKENTMSNFANIIDKYKDKPVNESSWNPTSFANIIDKYGSTKVKKK